MNQGVVCKVWNISGNEGGKSSTSNLTDSIGYILNDEKTEMHLISDKEDFNSKQLGRECRYVENNIKTVEGAFVGSRNLATTDINEAVQDMMEVKKFYGKLDGRSALHGVISLSEMESDIKNAPDLMAFCNDVLEELFPNHQAIFAVHTNTDNLHIHFIVNSVGTDGRKIHQPKNFVNYVLHPCVNKYAEKYGFTQNEEWKEKINSDKKNYVKIKMQLRKAIDIAIENSNDFDEFLKNIESQDIEIEVEKHITLLTEDMAKPIRTHQLGINYSKDAIIERIQTRKLAFEEFNASSFVDTTKDIDDLFEPVSNRLKKYRDMSDSEKAKTIKLIKMGVNPWRHNNNLNWQLKNISDELNMTNRAVHYIKAYSDNGDVNEALDKIIEIKKELSKEKKQIKEQMKRYKPITDIYNEMKKIEKKAYLYEYGHVSEYRKDYEQYRTLTRRLKNGYEKEIDDVAKLIDNFNNEILYINAQLGELSTEYRNLRKYCIARGINYSSNTLTDVIGYDESTELAKKGIFDTDISYVVSSVNSNITIRVIKSAYTDEKGRLKENIELTIVNNLGEAIDTCSIKENGSNGMKKFINRLEHGYDFQNCKSFKTLSAANSFTSKIKEELPESGKKSEKIIYENNDRNTYSFTAGINFLSVGKKEGMHVIVNSENSRFICAVKTSNQGIDMKILDNNGKEQETVNIPSFGGRNSNGYEIIKKIQEKYNFGDDMLVFENIEAARRYVNNTKKNER